MISHFMKKYVVFCTFLMGFVGLVSSVMALDAADVLFGAGYEQNKADSAVQSSGDEVPQDENSIEGTSVFNESLSGEAIPEISGDLKPASDKSVAVNQSISDGVVAEVNDYIITMHDLKGQMLLASRQYEKLPVPVPVFQQQILDKMIEDIIKTQYARLKGFSVTEEEIQAGVQRVAAGNGLTGEQFLTLVQGLEGPFRQKIQAQVLWDKVIQKSLLPQIDVSMVEADRIIKDILAGDVISERELSQIFIPTSVTGGQAILVKAKQAIKEEGETFGKVAQEISEGGASSKGGYLGWVSDGGLNETLEKALKDTQAGDIVGPIKTDAGWHLLTIHRVKKVPAVRFKPIKTVDVYLVSMPMGDEKMLRKLSRQNMSFEELKQTIDIKTDAIGELDLSDIDADIVAALPDETGFGDVFEKEGVFVVPFVAHQKKRMPQTLLDLRKKVEQKIKGNRLRMLERQLLHKIKSQAYVNVVTPR